MKIKYLTKITKPGKLRAFFTIELDNMLIRDMKLIQNDDGSFFAGFPSRKYTDKDGNEKYTNIIEITDSSLRSKIGEMARDAYQGIASEQDDQPPF